RPAMLAKLMPMETKIAAPTMMRTPPISTPSSRDSTGIFQEAYRPAAAAFSIAVKLLDGDARLADHRPPALHLLAHDVGHLRRRIAHGLRLHIGEHLLEVRLAHGARDSAR